MVRSVVRPISDKRYSIFDQERLVIKRQLQQSRRLKVKATSDINISLQYRP